MNAGRTIVVAVRDPDSANVALQRAMLLSDPSQDRLLLVHVSRLATLKRILELHPAPYPLPESGGVPERHEWVRELAESAIAAGYDARFEVLAGEAGVAIADIGRRENAAFVVVSTHREGQARELFVGSTALRILRSSDCPVVVARGVKAQPYRRAVIGIDLDETGQRVALASTTMLGDVDIDLVHAYRVPQESQLRMRGVEQEEILKLREYARSDLKPHLEAYRSAFPRAAIHLEHGFAASVILDHVLRLRPDVLVVGKHRGSSTEERVLGSVTQFLLYSCPTDLLLVP